MLISTGGIDTDGLRSYLRKEAGELVRWGVVYGGNEEAPPRSEVEDYADEMLLELVGLLDSGGSSELEDLLYQAWGVIANAHGGAWDQASPEWVAAAERWRDRWHAHLDEAKRHG
jgi:hypothetical protein